MKHLKMKGKFEEGIGGRSRAIDSTVNTVVGDVSHRKGSGATPESIIGKITKKK